jgi:hypothetical protein
MRRVYIAHPVSGDIESNLELASSWVRWAVMEMEVCPLAPYLTLCSALNDENEIERKIGFLQGLEQLKLCDELWVCGPTISEGMREEIDFAQRWMIPVKYHEQQRIRHKTQYEKCIHGKLLKVRCDKCGVVEEGQ